MSGRISKRIKFRDRPDWIMGRYFLFTLPYAFFFIIGSIVGYSRRGNLFCLLGGGGVGVLFLLLAAGHMIDYYRQVRIDSFYVGIPFSKLHHLLLYCERDLTPLFLVTAISVFLAILMTCIWALGGRFKTSGTIAFVVRLGHAALMHNFTLQLMNVRLVMLYFQCWAAVVWYFYAIVKDYGTGKSVREHTWYNPIATHETNSRGGDEVM